MRQILAFLLLSISLPVLAQRTGDLIQLSGKVSTSNRQTAAPFASVRVLNSNRGTLTDSSGNYSLQLLGRGPWQVEFTSVSFSPIVKNIEGNGPQIRLDVALQPALIQLNDQVVVTAQRYETQSFERPEAIAVVTNQDIARNALRSTPELLQGQPGVFVQKTNHGGGSPFVRGLTGQQTLLLVDGIRLNNATFRSGPNQYLNTLDPFLLDRIEVVRGGGSVQYGSDAMGGAINVLTTPLTFSQSRRLSGDVQAKLATGGMEKSGRVSVGYSGAKAAIQGGFSYRDFGDLVGGAGIGRQTPTGYDQYSLDLKSLVRINPNLRLTLAVQHLRQDSVPVFHKVQLEKFALNQFNPQVRTLLYARLEGYGPGKWVKSWQITPLASRTLEERQSRKVTATRTLAERDEVKTYGLLASFLSQPTSFWTIQTGAEWYYDQVASKKQELEPIWSSAGPPPVQRGLYPNQATMSNLAFYTLHTLRYQKWVLTAGGRFNTFAIKIPDSDLGTSVITPSALVGNAGLMYSVLPYLNLIVNANSSFRAPNIDDLGTLGIVDFRFEVPNTALKPERGFSKELGMKLRTNRLSSSLFVFHSQLTNLIGRIKTDEMRQDYPVYLKENIANAFIRGLEAETEWQLSKKWLLSGYLTYTYGQNVTSNEPYRRIPPLNGKVALQVQPTTNTWARVGYYFADRQDRLAKGDQDDNRIPAGGTPGWQVVHAAAGYQLGKLSLSAELQNLFNEGYRMHGSGVAEVGRSAWIRARYSW